MRKKGVSELPRDTIFAPKGGDAFLFTRWGWLYCSCSWKRHIYWKLLPPLVTTENYFSSKMKISLHICKVCMIKYYLFVKSKGCEAGDGNCHGLAASGKPQLQQAPAEFFLLSSVVWLCKCNLCILITSKLLMNCIVPEQIIWVDNVHDWKWILNHRAVFGGWTSLFLENSVIWYS